MRGLDREALEQDRHGGFRLVDGEKGDHPALAWPSHGGKSPSILSVLYLTRLFSDGNVKIRLVSGPF